MRLQKEKIRILQITVGPRKGVSGGIAAYLSNNFGSEEFDKDFIIDYLALSYQPFEPYREKLEKKGSRIESLGLVDNKFTLSNFRNGIKDYLMKNRYDIVEMGTGTPSHMMAVCRGARDAKAPVIVAHSHNALPVNIKRKVLYPYIHQTIIRNADFYTACSKDAAYHMYPKRIVESGRWMYIPNAIDARQYTFSSQIREQYRREFNIIDNFVVGHVGRLNTQKNHDYLIDVFACIHKRIKNSKLLLVGTGDLEKKLKEKCSRIGIDHDVIFTGQRKDVKNILQAMDVFVFPSLWEGVGIAPIEAQAAGLPCYISDVTPEEVKCTRLVHFLSLNVDPSKWAEKICEKVNASIDRKNRIIGSEFDIKVSTRRLADFYRSIVK